MKRQLLWPEPFFPDVTNLSSRCCPSGATVHGPHVHMKSSASTLSSKVSLQSRFFGAENVSVALVLLNSCLGELVLGSGLAESTFSAIHFPTVCTSSHGTQGGWQRAGQQLSLAGAEEGCWGQGQCLRQWKQAG